MRPLAILLGLTLLAGCAAHPSQSAGEAGALVYVQGVPFHPQLEAQCGPASLAAVLNYWGRPVAPAEIAEAVYVPRLKGSLSLDLWRYAQAQDLEASMDRGSLEYLAHHLAANEPVVAGLNLGSRLLPLGHFLVVVGLDPKEEMVIAYSGTEKDSRIPYKRFLADWEKTGFWALLVRSKEPGAHPVRGSPVSK